MYHLLLSAALFAVGVADNKMKPREKRIVWGREVLSDDYKISKYQTALLSGHYCKSQTIERVWHDPNEHYKPDWAAEVELNYIFMHCPVDGSMAFCGGAAISTYAVQTSCHCISRFDLHHEFSSPRTYNGWEDLVFMLIGARQISRAYKPYVSNRFILHEHCREVSNFTISHDFGIIVLRYPVTEQYVAPILTISELAYQWKYITRSESACLYMGWGSKDFINPDTYGPPSNKLLFGWRVVRNYKYCYDQISNFFKDDPEDSKRIFNSSLYKAVATWSCATHMGQFKNVIAFGDTGSPIACGGSWFYGIVGWTAEIITFDVEPFGDNPNATLYTYELNLDQSIAFSLWENSWNYRHSFDEWIRENKEIKGVRPTILRKKMFENVLMSDAGVLWSSSLAFSVFVLVKNILFSEPAF